VDPQERSLEVLVADGGSWTQERVFAGDDVVRATPFAGVEIALSRLWGG
jgi:Uma2 family endonuclease